jgi:hypothetical protein
LAYAALAAACGLLWLLCLGVIEVCVWFHPNVVAAKRKRAADLLRSQQAENEAAIDWGAQAWGKIKGADVRGADPRHHENILNAARAAIMRGEDPRSVVKRLVELGVDPSRQRVVPTQAETDARRAAGRMFGVAICIAVVGTWLAGQTQMAPQPALRTALPDNFSPSPAAVEYLKQHPDTRGAFDA